MKYKNYLAVSAIALICLPNTSWSSANPWEEFGLTEEEYNQQMNIFSDYDAQNEKKEMERILALIQEQEKKEQKQLLQSYSSNKVLLDTKEQKTSSSTSPVNAAEKDQMNKSLRDFAKSVHQYREYLKDNVRNFSQSLKDWLNDNNNLIKTLKKEPMCVSEFMTFLNTQTGKVDEKLLVDDNSIYLIDNAKKTFNPEDMKKVIEITRLSLNERFADAAPLLQKAYDAYVEALKNPCQESEKRLKDVIDEMDCYTAVTSESLDDFSMQFYKGVTFSGKALVSLDTSPSKPTLSGYLLGNVKNAKEYLIWMENEVKKSKSKIASETVMPYGQQAQKDKFSIAMIVKDVAHVFPEITKNALSDGYLENMVVESLEGGNAKLQARNAFNYIRENHGDTSFFKVNDNSPRYYLMDALRWVHAIKATYGNETALNVSAAYRIVEQGQKCGKGLMGRTLITYKEILNFLLEKTAQQYDLPSM